MTSTPHAPHRTQATPVNAPSEFDVAELFFSTTDEKGIIVSGNDVFVRVSGWSDDELHGAPHNIIRHPDMPRVVFQLLWQYLDRQHPIAAYVKNM
ncbi:MAG: PAS domain S-box protein, partial [Chloroflexota bacterium]